MSNDVFISHATDDQKLAGEVCARLEERGLACWIAPRDVAPGAVWDDAIVDAIDSAHAFLLILSTHANESPYVKNEVNHAFAGKRTIFTFRVEDVVPGKSLGFYLARHHWTDGFPPPLDEKVDRLAASIGVLIGKPIDAGAGVVGATGPGGVDGGAARPRGARWARQLTTATARLRRSLDTRVTVRRLAVGIVLAVIATGAVTWRLARPAPSAPAPSPRVSRLQIAPPSASAPTISTVPAPGLAITPEGTRVVYVGAPNGTLYVRALDQLDATPLLTGLTGSIGPFVSPDGQWIGFADGNTTLKKVAIAGGPAVTLAQHHGNLRGAAWGPDGTIVFATLDQTIGLQRIAAGGGEPTVLTRPNHERGEVDHLWPEFLPGGQAVLFTITATTGGLAQAQVAVLDLRSGTQTPLLRGGSDAHYVPSGHLVYGAAGALRAVAFDLARLAFVGTPVPVVPQVLTTAEGGVSVAVAGDGTAVYVPGVAAPQRTLVWVDRQGQETPLPSPSRGYTLPRLSPDGTRVALAMVDQELDIWLWDLVRGALTRLTFDPANENFPFWTPDGRRLIFGSRRAGVQNLFTQAADGTGTVERLTESPNPQNGATSISPDGTRLVFTENGRTTDADLMQLRLDGAHQVTPLVQTPFAERNGEISPDGRWLAYEANDSGSFEIFVRPFPDVAGGRWQVSTGGGTLPLWARSGQELFYLAPTGALMRVGVARGATWAATVPAKLFEVERYYTATAAGRSYDIAPDGQRFLMIKESTSAPPSFVVVQHFDEELRRLVPGK